MITIQPQIMQKRTFGNGGCHHHHENNHCHHAHNHKPNESHISPTMKRTVKGMGYALMIGVAAFVSHTIIAGPKCERIARKQVADSLQLVGKQAQDLPDSTLKRLGEEKMEANRQKVDSARAAVETMANNLGWSKNVLKDIF